MNQPSVNLSYTTTLLSIKQQLVHPGSVPWYQPWVRLQVVAGGHWTLLRCGDGKAAPGYGATGGGPQRDPKGGA